MTVEEALTQLRLGPGINEDVTDDYNDATDMAIEALEQGLVLDKIRAEIKEWYWQADKQALAKDPCVVDAMVDLFIRTIDKYRLICLSNL